MIFKVPKHKLNDGVWFLSERDMPLYGTIEMVSLAITQKDTNVYYSIKTDVKIHTIREDEIIEHNAALTKPVYQIGDEVLYEYLTENGSKLMTSSVIKRIDATFWEKDTVEITYTLENEDWIMEGEVLEKIDNVALARLPALER